MNETLEAIAQAIFKSWFVDFDPVRVLSGQMPEKPPFLTAEALRKTGFPDHLQDSELGEIPEGWHVTRLLDLTSYLNRGIGPAYVEDGGVCVLNQKCVRDHRVDFSKGRRHDPAKKGIGKHTLKLFDVLLNSTGVGTLGRAAQVLQLPEETIVDSHFRNQRMVR